jgi:tape measure domain-containing protein
MATQLEYTVSEKKFLVSMRQMAGAVGELTAKINVGLNRELRTSSANARTLDRGFGELGNRFKSFGTALSLGVTLPMAIMTKSASDAYAEYDSLRKALQAFYPTLDGLNGRIEDMRELAKLPGLGFQEAIQGDVRLRAVGITADQSTKILKEFANAIALTGGGKEKLNEVTIQLGQMAAKGKVLNQDLRPIIENAPAVATALTSMFGTVASDEISAKLEAAGLSSKEFISLLLTEMEKAPRVTGGWKNSLENLSDSLFVAKARMFEVVEVTFGLSERIDSLAATVEGAVEAFRGLPQGLQAAILGAIGLLTLIGPLSYGIGALITTIPKLIAGLYSVQIAAGAATLGFGILVTVLANAYLEHKRLDDLMKETSRSHLDAVNAVNAEKNELQTYVKILKDSASTTDQVKGAKDKLLAISGSFAESLKGEKIDFEKLEIAAGDYVKMLVLVEQQKRLVTTQADLEEELQSSKKPSFSNTSAAVNKTMSNFLFAMSPFGDPKDMTTLDENIAAGQKKVSARIGQAMFDNQAAMDNITKKIVAIQGANATPISPFTILGGDKADQDKLDKAAAKALKANLKRIKDEGVAIAKALKERLAMIKEASEQETIRRQLIDAMDPPRAKEDSFGRANADMATAGLGGLSETNIPMKLSKSDVTESIMFYQQTMDMARKDLKQFQMEMGRSMLVLSADFVGNLAEGLASGGGFGGAFRSLLNNLGSFISAYGMKALMITKLVAGFNKAFSIAPGSSISAGKAIALIAAGGLLKGLSGNIPALARGGVSTNPTLAMIGDNASGKEMVLPFERNNEFADAIAGRIGGGGGMPKELIVRGQDLVLVMERAKRSF